MKILTTIIINQLLWLQQKSLPFQTLWDNPTAMTCGNLVAELRTVAPGRVTVVSYDELKFALDCGIDVWDYAETLTLQAVIRDHGTPAQKQRLNEELIASRWATEIACAKMLED